MESIDKARYALKLVGERKAVSPVLFDVSTLTSYTDYFLVASGGSTRQVQAISRHLVRKMREAGWRAHGVEGEDEGQWVLLDYGDLVIHVFYESVRAFYDLEGLWVEAPRIGVRRESQEEQPDETGG